MKGIVLAGGAGMRLHPKTLSASKQPMPVYGKPMAYCPLSVLMLANVREIMVVSTPHDLPLFGRLLGDGGQWGVRISCAEQDPPCGIAHALVLAGEFLVGGSSMLVLGDNVFHGHDPDLRPAGGGALHGAAVFACRVADPERCDVVEFDADGRRALSLEDKPRRPRSDWAVTGLYACDGQAPAMARALAPSACGELENTDLNRVYMDEGSLRVGRLGRGYAWLDTGTHENLLEAGEFVRAVDERNGRKVAGPEGVARHMDFISDAELLAAAAPLRSPGHGAYLEGLRPARLAAAA